MKKHILLMITSLTCLVLLFLLVQPEGKPLVYIFFPVVLMWLFLYSVVQVIFGLLFKERSLMRSILAFVGVSFVVLLILLSGVDQLTVTDIVLSSGLVLVSSFYFYRMWD